MSNLHKIVFYDDWGSLELLVGAIIVAPLEIKASILAQTSVIGLIKMPFLLRFLTKLMSVGPATSWITASFQNSKESTGKTWLKFLDHILNGKDKTNEKSAGGLNETELWTFLEILSFNDFEPTELMLNYAKQTHNYEH